MRTTWHRQNGKRRGRNPSTAPGVRCQVCNTDKSILDTHHRTYERLGRELDGDLIVLCRDCHRIFHENGKLAR